MALTELEVGICNQALDRIGAKTFDYGDTTSIQSIRCLRHYEQTRNALLKSFEWPFAKTRLRLAGDWVTDTAYTTDQYVWSSSLLYKCIVAHTSGTFADDLTSVYWTLVSSIDAWVTLTTYVVGEYVTTNALLYKCIVEHDAGTFATDLAAGDWSLVSVKPTNIFGYNYDIPSNCLRIVEVDTDEVPWSLETNTILTDSAGVDLVYVNKITDTTEWSALFTEVLVLKLALVLFNPMTGLGSGSTGIRELLLKELHVIMKQVRTIGRQEGNNSGSSDWNEARHK